ncbi:MAG: family 43 glycosylhydrolase, partial [Gemmatimonadetes bacterium]|nr:family 43 glycosylhydrolase [Gemmatimonadota bacterium]
MRQTLIGIVAVTLLFGGQPIAAQPAHSGNPILPGWYADPEAHVFEGQYWIYPTYSAPYGEQTFLDAFSSNDLVTWTRHPHVLDTADVRWAHRAVWAPSIVQKDGWYYLFFGANDIQNDRQQGGIGVARSRSPAGPFKDWLGKPLVDAFHNGAQPIDQMVFRDVDGTYYIAYGGWGHCNIAKLNADFTGLVPFPDGTTFKEITPKGYVEGVFMLVKDGKYYLMWSEGGWTGPDYAVAYAVGTSPFGPFERVGKILQQDPTVATGAGHHSVLHADGSPNWYIVYHRRPLGETDRNHRVVSIDTLRFDAQGFIQPVVITKSGVAADPLPPVPAQNPPDWTEPFPPFRIAGNLYYVGSKGLASYLIATPEGHVLINSDLEANVPMITASVESLGFRFEDVKVLLISHAHWDHDAGSALVKRMTGASYMVMDADVPVVESGGARDFHYGDRTDLRYPAVKVDRVLHDGDEVRLGGAVLTA